MLYLITYHPVTNSARYTDPTVAPGTEIMAVCRYTLFVTSTMSFAFVVYVRHSYGYYFLMHTIVIAILRVCHVLLRSS